MSTPKSSTPPASPQQPPVLADSSGKKKGGYANVGWKGRTTRESIRITERRLEAAKLYAAGYPQAEIGLMLGVTRTTITSDLQLVRRDWRQSAICNFNERIERELELIDKVELEAWAAWERSQRPFRQVTKTIAATEASAASGGKIAPATPEISHIKRGQCGDPRYLDQVLKCIEQRRKLLGLDAATKTEQTITADVSVTNRFLGRAKMRQEVEAGLQKLRSEHREAVTHQNPN